MIIEASDPAALAVLGAVSFDILVASSHLLYKEVRMQSLSSLEQLFGPPSPSSSQAGSDDGQHHGEKGTLVEILAEKIGLACEEEEGVTVDFGWE